MKRSTIFHWCFLHFEFCMHAVHCSLNLYGQSSSTVLCTFGQTNNLHSPRRMLWTVWEIHKRYKECLFTNQNSDYGALVSLRIIMGPRLGGTFWRVAFAGRSAGLTGSFCERDTRRSNFNWMLSSRREAGKHLSFCFVSWRMGASTFDLELLLEFLFELFLDWTLDALEECFDTDLESFLLDFLMLPWIDLLILLRKHLFA